MEEYELAVFRAFADKVDSMMNRAHHDLRPGSGRPPASSLPP